jgi:hypothetical protein
VNFGFGDFTAWLSEAVRNHKWTKENIKQLMKDSQV